MFTVAESTVLLWLWMSLFLSLFPGSVWMLAVDWRGWYKSLNKLPMPPIVFMVVWPILYVLRALGCYYAFNNLNHSTSWHWAGFAMALLVYALSALWGPIFFGLRMVLLSNVLVALHLLFSVLLCAFAWQVRALSGGLLLPEPIWLLVALILNTYITFSNRLHNEPLMLDTSASSKEEASA